MSIIKTKHTSPIKNSDGFKRYYTMDYYLKHRFNKKMCKVPLSTGCSCPNRDGTKGTGGCFFCSGAGGGEFAPSSQMPLKEQFDIGSQLLKKKWKDAGFIGYFQSFTNTHTTPQHLYKFLDEAQKLPIESIRIATRPDCLDSEKANILKEFSQKIPLVVEMGLQTVFDETSKKMNRCHSFSDFLIGCELLKDRNLPFSVHIINGLPEETPEMMLKTAKTAGSLNPLSLKIHMLHILKGSRLGEIYEKTPFPLLSREEYIKLVCDQIEVIPETVVIERLTGDGASSTLIAPIWTKKKLTIINDIDKELFNRNSYQGKMLR